MTVTAGEVTAASGGVLLQGNPREPIGRVSIDSRSLAAGDFFVAIRGERFDGHQFVAAALARGAAGALVDAVPDDVEVRGGDRGPAMIRVTDTTEALQRVARDVRRRAGCPVIAITGSAGKTTTKEVTAAFLATRYRVFRNKGNLNNHIGLPISLLELRDTPDVAVVELGMNHAGEIRTLVGIAEPDIRVWTNVGDAHLGFFESADAIADAKGEILEHATTATRLIANANDQRIMARLRAFPGTVTTFGIDVAADVEARQVQALGLDGMAAEVRTPVGTARLRTPLLGMGNLANVLAATAVAVSMGVSLDDIVAVAATLEPAAHRGELLRLPGGLTLVDDSYNSSPAALTRALETIGVATGSARKAAVLGEMLELGAHSQRLHEECGRAAAAAGLNWLVTVGGAPAKAMADAAVSAGLSSSWVRHLPNRDEAATAVMKIARPGDLVLVKGSRGIGTDLVVDRLRVEFA
ncbi:MAG: UDP-N-acetylmuramoyl-tripeptide--D-alanyl-D-alanine ligase [Vicinamibacterales bacterium]